MNKENIVFISCEHAVNTVPEPYSEHFNSFQDLLNTHRGVDFGAAAIAQHLSATLGCAFFQSTATRLLVDCNRSLRHRTFFSEITKTLPKAIKKNLIDEYYLPYRQQVINFIHQEIAGNKRLIHLSIHSFTPVLHGITRKTDLGILYHPRRSAEKEAAKKWRQAIMELDSNLRTRMNYPYKGAGDGFTNCLRRQFHENDYLGLQIEVNQALSADAEQLDRLNNLLANSVLKMLHTLT